MGSLSQNERSQKRRLRLYRRGFVVLLFVSVVAAIISYDRIEKASDPIRFHVRSLQAIQRTDFGRKPTHLRDYFKLSTLRWYASGQPSDYEPNWIREENGHLAELFKLGYLEERTFQLDQPWLSPYGAQLSKALMSRPTDPNWWVFLNFTSTNQISVTCAKTNMTTVAKIIENLGASSNSS